MDGLMNNLGIYTVSMGRLAWVNYEHQVNSELITSSTLALAELLQVHFSVISISYVRLCQMLELALCDLRNWTGRFGGRLSYVSHDHGQYECFLV